jgi:hypothetical protein
MICNYHDHHLRSLRHFWWYWSLNLGPHTFYEVTLPLEPCLHPIGGLNLSWFEVVVLIEDGYGVDYVV